MSHKANTPEELMEWIAGGAKPNAALNCGHPGCYSVLRIQDKDGRGPWKPGFSNCWVEARSDEEYAALLPWLVEFGRAPLDKRIVGMHIGCACRSLEQMRRWFTPTEYAKLRSYGYNAVRLEVGRILAESDIQCVFERAKPLSEDVEVIELYPHNAEVSDGRITINENQQTRQS